MYLSASVSEVMCMVEVQILSVGYSVYYFRTRDRGIKPVLL